MASTRDRALTAAIRLVGGQGVRALTHARVDAEAGLPKGSTSNWFRTRDALVAGVIVTIAEQERAELAAVLTFARTADEVIDILSALVEDATGTHVCRTRARYALFLETAATPDARAPMRTQRSMFEEWTRGLMSTLGARDPDAAARAMLAVCAGLIVNRLTVAPEGPIRPVVELAMRGCLSA
ncbi:DNA-binding transcriptional regulator YbjK [Arthrobacter stackebrandtii]|uniref:DNA-binding transcriptional regulator YbjK n=1 Tax=Arthrobacter stackebrandtii TaxID=272161 RepID=A0ABS4YYI8_9MICC|nr:TetR family transcriptional regulator [Arthrobacter stackebrandtii]MBP2413843.1 DNA-binding transcriptional regulator YbjK [Arthrobacter stackebrandtii]PYH00418.1 TetR family transcriptional regulator [Arthrobacter stackebrandtii]